MNTLALAVLLTTTFTGQGIPKIKHAPVGQDTKQAVVTQAEARSVLLRAEKIFVTVLEISPNSKVTIPDSSAPVTRGQVINDFNRLFDLGKPKFKFTPNPVVYDAKRLTIKDPKQLASLKKLISYGCIARIGPVAAGSSDSLTVQAFGDSVGFFMARIAQLTHMPSTKWTPGLKGD